MRWTRRGTLSQYFDCEQLRDATCMRSAHCRVVPRLVVALRRNRCFCWLHSCGLTRSVPLLSSCTRSRRRRTFEGATALDVLTSATAGRVLRGPRRSVTVVSQSRRPRCFRRCRGTRRSCMRPPLRCRSNYPGRAWALSATCGPCRTGTCREQTANDSFVRASCFVSFFIADVKPVSREAHMTQAREKHI